MKKGVAVQCVLLPGLKIQFGEDSFSKDGTMVETWGLPWQLAGFLEKFFGQVWGLSERDVEPLWVSGVIEAEYADAARGVHVNEVRVLEHDDRGGIDIWTDVSTVGSKEKQSWTDYHTHRGPYFITHLAEAGE